MIDFGALSVGDPACDVMVAWKMLPAEVRNAFRAALSVDEATWARSRGWALSQAVTALAYYTEQTNAVLVGEAKRWLTAVLADHDLVSQPMTSNSEQLTERRVGRGRTPATEMSPHELLKLVYGLEDAGVKVWLDGGWGVDALLGEQRRQHDDLDLVVEVADLPTLKEILANAGYVLLGGGAPMSFEMVDSDGRQVDVHPVTFNERGDGVYRMRSGEDWIYPAAGFAGTGQVFGRQVHCLSPVVQMLCHTGYELSEKDHEEIRALQEIFGVEPPSGYKPPSSDL